MAISSSVDFCEPNYYISKYIAEFHNTWSSLFITLISIFGFKYCNNTNEKRHSGMFILLGVVGIGSVFLHATLHWLGQSIDEIPMMLFNISFIYNLIELKAPFNKPIYPNLPLYCVLFAIVQIMVYFYF
jgi:dihydroceramidase